MNWCTPRWRPRECSTAPLATENARLTPGPWAAAGKRSALTFLLAEWYKYKVGFALFLRREAAAVSCNEQARARGPAGWVNALSELRISPQKQTEAGTGGSPPLDQIG